MGLLTHFLFRQSRKTYGALDIELYKGGSVRGNRRFPGLDFISPYFFYPRQLL